MESDYRHTILIVEGNAQNKKVIASILQTEEIDTVFSDTGASAIEEIKVAKKPFSLIVSAQNLEDMAGIPLLEQAKELAPDSIRFLMAAYSEIELIINAVNKSSVHRFLVKPFEPIDFLKAVQSSLKLYNSFVEHEKLLKLAKQQNSKLYELNCQLMETVKSHQKNILRLDNEIKTINDEILALSSQQQKPSKPVFDKISNYVAIDQGLGAAKIDAAKVDVLFSETIHTLYNQFDELAQRAGFEMPHINGDTP
ncbi:MAG: response regulator [Pseudomonadota bacterium]